MSILKANRIENLTTTDGGINVNNAGNVGIGTASPHGNSGTNLHIHGSNTTAELRLTNTTTGTGANGSIIQQGGNTLYISNSEAGSTAFENNGSERVRITSSGQLLVGASSGGANLVIGDVNTPSFNRGAVAIKAVNDGNTIPANIYLEEASGAEGYTLSIDSDGDLNFHNSGAPTPTVTFSDLDRVGIGTATPGDQLHIHTASSGAANVRFSSTDVPNGFFVGFDGQEIGQIWHTANKDIRIATNNTERMRIDSSGRLGIGISSPSKPLHIYQTADAGIRIQNSTTGTGTTDGILLEATGSDGLFWNYESGNLRFATGNSERMRIDSSGRLLVGTTSTRSNIASTAQDVVIERASIVSQSLVANQNASGGSTLSLCLSRGTSVGSNTVVQSGDTVGVLAFRGNDGTNFLNLGMVKGEVDGTPGANDMPGRLTFFTTADGASSPTERMRIDSSGRVGINNTSPGSQHFNDLVIGDGSANDAGLTIHTSTSGSGSIAFSDGTSGAARFDGYLQYDHYNQSFKIYTNGGNERMRIDSSGRVGIGTSSPGNPLHIADQKPSIRLQSNSGSYQGRNTLGQYNNILYLECDNDNAVSNSAIAFTVDATERMRIGSNGYLYFANQTNANPAAGGATGLTIRPEPLISIAANGNSCTNFGRNTNDGAIVNFYQAGSLEGSISVSGSTVSYNGGHLTRWSQLASGAARTEILRGSVLSNLDEMCEWGEENNEQLNRMKVSDVEGDVNVSGVFQAWDDDDDTYVNDFYCAMTGDFVIRIAQGTTVARGDLLMSAGDGTAKPQDDDIVRSKTIAKVTSTTVSTTYSDGSYCVPCVLMAC